eukprot:TRINITY_DN34312_c0_g1_i1.p1 TRINITY_DN34312_c0_g1~~TRINITY_DN34312_c0_g1_i1.p1  ORF type:complete len:410 (+),score=40.55 TRINITY_DN34312_c0_g1_i1:103-1332(+)
MHTDSLEQESNIPSSLSTTSSRSEQMLYFRDHCGLDDQAARLVVRAERLQEKGQLQQAALYFREVLRISPTCREAQFNLEMIERLTASETSVSSTVGIADAERLPQEDQPAESLVRRSDAYEMPGPTMNAILTFIDARTPASSCRFRHCELCGGGYNAHGMRWMRYEQHREFIRVRSILPESPADRAGVVMGAIICQVDDATTFEDMNALLRQGQFPLSLQFCDDNQFAVDYLLTQQSRGLWHAGARLRSDPDVVLQALESKFDMHGMSFEYAAEELRDNEQIVLIAVRKKTFTFRYASDRLKRSTLILRTIANIEAEKRREELRAWNVGIPHGMRRCKRCRKCGSKSAFFKKQWSAAASGSGLCIACLKERQESIDESYVPCYHGHDDPDRYMGHGEFDDGPNCPLWR